MVYSKHKDPSRGFYAVGGIFYVGAVKLIPSKTYTACAV